MKKFKILFKEETYATFDTIEEALIFKNRKNCPELWTIVETNKEMLQITNNDLI